MSTSGAVRKLWTKLSPVAIIEQTQMRAEFLKAVEEYDAYKEVVEDLVDKLESFVKTSPLTSAFGEHPVEKLADTLTVLKTHLTPECGLSILKTRENPEMLDVVQHSSTQTRGRQAIHNIRRFLYIEYKELIEEREKLDSARKYMDQMRNGVKQAKTAEKIKNKAILYEQAVISFDLQAEKVVDLLEKLPGIKQEHQKDLLAFFNAIGAENGSTTKTMIQT